MPSCAYPRLTRKTGRIPRGLYFTTSRFSRQHRIRRLRAMPNRSCAVETLRAIAEDLRGFLRPSAVIGKQIFRQTRTGRNQSRVQMWKESGVKCLEVGPYEASENSLHARLILSIGPRNASRLILRDRRVLERPVAFASSRLKRNETKARAWGAQVSCAKTAAAFILLLMGASRKFKVGEMKTAL